MYVTRALTRIEVAPLEIISKGALSIAGDLVLLEQSSVPVSEGVIAVPAAVTCASPVLVPDVLWHLLQHRIQAQPNRILMPLASEATVSRVRSQRDAADQGVTKGHTNGHLRVFLNVHWFQRATRAKRSRMVSRRSVWRGWWCFLFGSTGSSRSCRALRLTRRCPG